MSILVIGIVAIVCVSVVYTLVLNKRIEDITIEYTMLETERDLLKEQNAKLKKELELQMQANKAEAKIASNEKVSKPRGRKPKNAKNTK